MRILVNQPVNFQTDPFDNPYIDSIKYKQLVQQGDITQFQFGTTSDVGSKNTLTNGTFGVSTQGWYTPGTTKGVLGFTVDNGELYYKQSGKDLNSAAIQQDALVVGENYEINISITASFNGYWEMFLGTNRVAQLTTGLHKVGGICEDTKHFTMKFIPYIFSAPSSQTKEEFIQLNTAEGRVDWVLVQRKVVTNHRFSVVDVEDSTIATTFDAITDYLTAPYTASADAQFQQDSLTMSLDWQDKAVANGCYQIGVADADISTNLQCGAFNSEFYGGAFDEDGFEYMPNWRISSTQSGTVVFNANDVTLQTTNAATGGAEAFAQSGLKLGVVYDYSFEIVSITGVGTTMDVFVGSGATNSYTTAGTKTATLTCTTTTNLSLIMTCAAVGTCTIKNIRIQAQDADLEYDYYSNPFNLATTHNRTFVVNCNNTNNVFGLTFERAIWTPRARLQGYIAPDDNAYITEREHSETSYGKREVFYFKRRKQQLLIIENEPEFMHDWLSLLGGHDHSIINNLEYFINEDDYPAISWDKWRVVGSTQIPITVKQALERKTIKGYIGLPQFIADADGFGILGGFLGEPIGNSNIGQVQGTWDGVVQLIDPDALLQTGTTAVTGTSGQTIDEISPYEGGSGTGSLGGTGFALPGQCTSGC